MHNNKFQNLQIQISSHSTTSDNKYSSGINSNSKSISKSKSKSKSKNSKSKSSGSSNKPDSYQSSSNYQNYLKSQMSESPTFENQMGRHTVNAPQQPIEGRSRGYTNLSNYLEANRPSLYPEPIAPPYAYGNYPPPQAAVRTPYGPGTQHGYMNRPFLNNQAAQYYPPYNYDYERGTNPNYNPHSYGNAHMNYRNSLAAPRQNNQYNGSDTQNMNRVSGNSNNSSQGGLGDLFRDLPNETRSNYMNPNRISRGSNYSFRSGFSVQSTPDTNFRLVRPGSFKPNNFKQSKHSGEKNNLKNIHEVEEPDSRVQSKEYQIETQEENNLNEENNYKDHGGYLLGFHNHQKWKNDRIAYPITKESKSTRTSTHNQNSNAADAQRRFIWNQERDEPKAQEVESIAEEMEEPVIEGVGADIFIYGRERSSNLNLSALSISALSKLATEPKNEVEENRQPSKRNKKKIESSNEQEVVQEFDETK